MRVAQQQRVSAESAEEREARLHQLRVVQQQRITAESAEERVARLQQLRFGQQQRITAESTEERETRLQQARSAQDWRIATQSAEEREAHLQYARSAQDRRIATESAEEREARLQQLRVAQQQRIATETSEEIQARRARDRRNHMDLKTAEVPLFQQTCVCFKMRQFHSRLNCLRLRSRSPHNAEHSTSYDSLCRRSSRSPIMLSILLVGRAGASPPSRTAAIIFLYIYLYPCRTSCPKSSTCFFFSDISIFLRRKCYTGFFFCDISIFPNLCI